MDSRRRAAAAGGRAGRIRWCASRRAAGRRCAIQLQAARRGAFTLDQVHLRVRSRLGLWQRFLDYPGRKPDPRLSRHEAVGRIRACWPAPTGSACWACGARRKIGQDNEFERLRDFTRDDNYKHIDWRSTARRNKLTVKDFQANQSQRLLFLIDCGRMMASEAAGLSLLDHALNAMLMLSYVALRQGDSVGLICFFRRDP